jgi:hypothetical protein
LALGHDDATVDGDGAEPGLVTGELDLADGARLEVKDPGIPTAAILRPEDGRTRCSSMKNGSAPWTSATT